MKENKFIRVNLQLFADGGESGADGTTGVNAGVPDLQAKGEKNSLANITYGKQQQGSVQTADAQKQEPAKRRDLNAEFESLIKGDFKDVYNSKMQDTIQKRLKGSKEIVEKYNSLTPTLEMLAQKYGISDYSDIEALNKAIEEDSSYYEQEALERGIDVEQFKEVKKIERENKLLRKQINAAEEQKKADRDIALWMEQAKEASEVFPGLDLGEELKNPQFLGLLKNNVDIQTAYFAIHHRELVPKAMQYASQETKKNIANSVRNNSSRPNENGMQSQASSLNKTDVSSLTKEDREEIARRVARGDRITFSS